MTKLSILIATTDTKILNNGSFMSMNFHHNFQAIIVNQKINNFENLKINKAFVHVINSEEKGLSNSRNLALQYAKAEYVLICDDDVEFLYNLEVTLTDAISQHPKADVLSFKILKNEKEDFKKYPKNKFSIYKLSLQNKMKILKISSIEILFKRSFLEKNHLRFNKDFGVGSGKYPMGEEILLLHSVIQKKGTIQYLPQPIFIHREESSGQNFTPKKLQALGYIYQMFWGIFMYPFAIYYVLKKRKKLKANKISISSALLAMWNYKMDVND